jgi:hypothetical protein
VVAEATPADRSNTAAIVDIVFIRHLSFWTRPGRKYTAEVRVW